MHPFIRTLAALGCVSAATLSADSLGVARASEKAAFSLTTAAFASGGTIPNAQVFNGFGCSGENISPALAWTNAPAGTRSFALMVHDPDAPTGSGWWHWVVVGIPASASSLPGGAGAADGKGLPAGAVQTRTDFGTVGYGGPCPPAGDKPHRYYFRLFALKVEKLDLPPDATAAMVGFFVQSQSLATAELLGTYGR
jgi:hypothetical protein